MLSCKKKFKMELLRKKRCWLYPAPGRGRTPSQGPWDLVGRGAAQGRTTYPSLSLFFGLIFLLISGAGLGAWVGVTGCSRCCVRLVILAGLSLPLFFAWVGLSA